MLGGAVTVYSMLKRPHSLPHGLGEPKLLVRNPGIILSTSAAARVNTYRLKITSRRRNNSCNNRNQPSAAAFLMYAGFPPAPFTTAEAY